MYLTRMYVFVYLIPSSSKTMVSTVSWLKSIVPTGLITSIVSKISIIFSYKTINNKPLLNSFD